jgi:hypothetical protein
MNFQAIEDYARELQIRIWRERSTLFPLGVPPAAQLCDPCIAARIVGLEYVEYETLGRFGNGPDRFETAGMLNREQLRLGVSLRFEYQIRRFTAAHEIGHFLLHPHAVMHRDRPVSSPASNRPALEREADAFAAFFLAPAKLVRDEFNARFGQEPLYLTDVVAFNLCGIAGSELMNARTDSLRFAVAVATARRFNGKHFKALHEVFGLSGTAMGLRLRELKLIAP